MGDFQVIKKIVQLQLLLLAFAVFHDFGTFVAARDDFSSTLRGILVGILYSEKLADTTQEESEKEHVDNVSHRNLQAQYQITNLRNGRPANSEKKESEERWLQNAKGNVFFHSGRVEDSFIGGRSNIPDANTGSTYDDPRPRPQQPIGRASDQHEDEEEQEQRPPGRGEVPESARYDRFSAKQYKPYQSPDTVVIDSREEDPAINGQDQSSNTIIVTRAGDHDVAVEEELWALDDPKDAKQKDIEKEKVKQFGASKSQSKKLDAGKWDDKKGKLIDKDKGALRLDDREETRRRDHRTRWRNRKDTTRKRRLKGGSSASY